MGRRARTKVDDRHKEPMAAPKTTPRIRRAIQASDEKNTDLARHYGIHRQTVAKWKARDTSIRHANGSEKSQFKISHAERTKRSFSPTAGAPASRSITRM